MPQVPRPTHSRSTHGRAPRSSHGHSGYLPAIEGWREVYEQAAVDTRTPEPARYDAASIPPAAVNRVAPAVPTGLTLTSQVRTDADGRAVLVLVATLAHPTVDGDGGQLSDLHACHVEVTADNDADPQNPQPLWTNPVDILIGTEVTAGALVGVRGATVYWARAYAVDIFGNRSAYTSTVSATTGRDTVAPDMPSDVNVASAFRGFGMSWNAGTAPDLWFNEVRYAPDNGTGSAPNTGLWVYVRVATNVVLVTGLDYGRKYWTQVRAVDLSGNVVTSASVSTAVDWLTNPEAGWTTQTAVVPAELGQTDIAFNSIISNHIATAGLDAGVIKTGLLKVNTSSSSMIDGIEIYNGATRIGKWDETGLYIGKNTGGLPTNLASSDYVRITDAGLTVYLAGVATSAITPNGINATAINFGSLPGGHNLVRNSSFELADFTAAATQKTWTVAADWTGTQVSSTNVTNGTNSVTITAVTY